MSVIHYTTTGRFNLMRDELQQQVVLITPAGNVDQVWPEGEANYEDDMLPSEVARLLRERLNSYLFSSRRAETLVTLDAIDKRANEFDLIFATKRAEQLEELAKDWRLKAQAIKEEIEEAQQ